MILQWLIVVLQLVGLFIVSVGGSYSSPVYCVDSGGTNSSNCLDFVNGCCESLTLLLTELYRNTSRPTRITIEIGSDLFLNETAKFEDFDSIEILGINDPSVTCLENEYYDEMNAGLYFKEVDNILMTNLTFLHCGSLQNNSLVNCFHSSLYFHDCSNLTLENIAIKDGHGTGAILYNVFGTVGIFHSLFDNNTVGNPKMYSGGGGLLIVFTNFSSGKLGQYSISKDEYKNSHYTIQNCTFSNNNASSLEEIYIRSDGTLKGFGRGGGLAVYLDGNTKWCSLTITECFFQNNSAYLGGGIFVMFRRNVSYNSVTVKDSDFITNHAISFSPHRDHNIDERADLQKLLQRKGGGGGGAGGGFLLNKQYPVNNSLVYINCRFIGNHADGNGGGLSIFSTRMVSSHNASKNHIKLINCSMHNNSAYVASALDLSPEVYDRLGYGTLPVPIIKNCSFVMNIILNRNLQNIEFVKTFLNGIATVFISTFLVKFYGTVTFMHNNETALHLSSASINLTKGSCLHFEGNHGKNGGAVSMIARSVMHVEDECDLRFINNSAVAKGGAFYVYSIDHQHEVQFSHSCFIQYQNHREKSTSKRNIHFLFRNNSALTGIGDVLYATSLLPCTYGSYAPKDVFDSIGHVDSQTEREKSSNISTLAYNFKFNNQSIKQMQHLFPGVQFNMTIEAIDELNQTQNTKFYAHMDPPQEDITVDPAYTQVSNNIIKLRGRNFESKRDLILETSIARISIDVALEGCPPGFVITDDACECVASSFFGIARCDKNRSYIFRGYWVGQCHNRSSICSAHCPNGYCYRNQKNSEEFLLPPDIDKIDEFICGPYRTGILCGQCVDNSSVQYHSHSYSCKPNKYCNLGIFFYFLSEILPLIIFFLVVTIFNISFTSGTLNGFILFAQMSDTIDLNAGGTIGFPQPLEIVTYPYQLIYRMFNFDFFSLDALSFCLWKHATTMDALIMKFVTITFAVLLIVLIIFIFNTWKFRVWCHWFRAQTLKAAFTHGLSTLLIVSFSQCARVSFLILSPTKLQRHVGTYTHTIPVVFYSGNLQPFVGKHLKYAIPAVFFLLVLVILPLLWLLSYPLLFKLLGICHASETKFSVYLSRLFPIELLDSFQSCFKENHRYFAGLYLLYRLIPLVVFANFHRLLQFHVILSLHFLIMFTLHSMIQPYKSKYHNRVDSFILANISLVNTLTIYNYAVLSTGDQEIYKLTVHWIIYLQIILMYCPLIYLLCYCATEVYSQLKMQCKGYLSVSSEDTDLLPPLRDS